MNTEVSMKNTKKEMLDIISDLKKKMDEKEKSRLNPEKVKEESRKVEIIKKADQTADSDLSTLIHQLKISITKELTDLSDNIGAENLKYQNIKDAIELKQAELADIYGIEKATADLAVVLEAQNRAKEEFDSEMTDKRKKLEDELTNKHEKLETEIRETKLSWEKEKSAYVSAFQEEKEKDKKERKREIEEYQYQLKRTRELENNKFADDMEKLEKEIIQKKEHFDKIQEAKNIELAKREKTISEREKIMNELQKQVDLFPAQLEKSINSSINETEKRLVRDFSKNEELLIKGFEGERNVLQAKVNALESQCKDQAKQIEKLNIQQENAYEKVQDIASKAVAGSSDRLQNVLLKTAENERNIKNNLG